MLNLDGFHVITINTMSIASVQFVDIEMKIKNRLILTGLRLRFIDINTLDIAAGPTRFGCNLFFMFS